MKKYILSAFLIAIWTLQINAQSNIKLNIQHKLSDAGFEMNAGAQNNMGHDFKVSRLEYYISEISLIHDGGQETAVEDLYLLVNAASRTTAELGEFNIDKLEKIKFHIGVDPDHNHLDPTSFPTSHPLAPKAPSMHWGWAAGYRFVAMEGNGGSSYNQLFQLHGLGDINYQTTEVDLDLTGNNNEVNIDLHADYTKLLENISVNSGVIVHGDNLQAKQCLENFRDYVFSSPSITSSTIDFSEVNSFGVYPNPVVANETRVKLDIANKLNNYNIQITSVEGKLVQNIISVNDGQTINLDNYAPGMYFVNLVKEGHIIITEKIFVK